MTMGGRQYLKKAYKVMCINTIDENENQLKK